MRLTSAPPPPLASPHEAPRRWRPPSPLCVARFRVPPPPVGDTPASAAAARYDALSVAAGVVAAYHGSAGEHWLPILRAGGLVAPASARRRSDGDGSLVHGDVYGHGVYLATERGVAAAFAPLSGSAVHDGGGGGGGGGSGGRALPPLRGRCDGGRGARPAGRAVCARRGGGWGGGRACCRCCRRGSACRLPWLVGRRCAAAGLPGRGRPGAPPPAGVDGHVRGRAAAAADTQRHRRGGWWALAPGGGRVPRGRPRGRHCPRAATVDHCPGVRAAAGVRRHPAGGQRLVVCGGAACAVGPVVPPATASAMKLRGSRCGCRCTRAAWVGLLDEWRASNRRLASPWGHRSCVACH
ncbi:hypothetical protein BU14_0171s0017 [Porphyra umbilicalis]|uniref:Uncharacterized protein n=1 Tax=Porphyra umbilicalis TaxID=2786 RepID=A0A1X6P7N4_PORUM|nr:hypothetical protein BU14_0171s0017 [Porphyra umbilicalis]|eukprot:OSX76868.1 hypothetical protein BU14_0171s0017 [Porphyra umbilicalis]